MIKQIKLTPEQLNRTSQTPNDYINSVFVQLQPALTETINELPNGGACVLFTRIGYEALTKLGVPVTVAGGRCMLSVNPGNNGVLFYGFEGQYENHFDAMPSGHGRTIGHFWLNTPWGIVDFTLPFAKALYLKSNDELGIKDKRWHLPKNILIKPEQNFSRDELMAGTIGHHYAEIEGRGEAVWDDKPSLL